MGAAHSGKPGNEARQCYVVWERVCSIPWSNVPGTTSLRSRRFHDPINQPLTWTRVQVVVWLCKKQQSCKHQDRHPKSLVRLCILCGAMLRGKKKKNIEWDSNWLTESEPNHLSMGAWSHRTDCTQTHVVSYGEWTRFSLTWGVSSDIDYV